MDTYLMTPDSLAKYMSNATSEGDWENRVESVIAAHGDYPPFWFQVVVLSGLMERTTARWQGTGTIRINGDAS